MCTPPPLSAGEGGFSLYQIFKKRGLDRTSSFRVAGKERVTFFKGGCNFSTKNKLKSGIFNDKKSL